MSFTVLFIRHRAKQIHEKIALAGAQQVRLWHGMLLTYPYPARRGYGTRGEIIGVYRPGVVLQWILDDLLELEGITQETQSGITHS